MHFIAFPLALRPVGTANPARQPGVRLSTTAARQTRRRSRRPLPAPGCPAAAHPGAFSPQPRRVAVTGGGQRPAATPRCLRRGRKPFKMASPPPLPVRALAPRTRCCASTPAAVTTGRPNPASFGAHRRHPILRSPAAVRPLSTPISPATPAGGRRVPAVKPRFHAPQNAQPRAQHLARRSPPCTGGGARTAPWCRAVAPSPRRRCPAVTSAPAAAAVPVALGSALRSAPRSPPSHHPSSAPAAAVLRVGRAQRPGTPFPSRCGADRLRLHPRAAAGSGGGGAERRPSGRGANPEVHGHAAARGGHPRPLTALRSRCALPPRATFPPALPETQLPPSPSRSRPGTAGAPRQVRHLPAGG